MCKVLVVEDEYIVAADLARSLSVLGYDVTAVTDSGSDAVRIAEKECPDLVLMDIRLRGEMNGIAAGAEVWRRWKIPVVFMTSYSDPDTVSRAKDASPFGYIVKPFRPTELDATLRVALHQHRLSREMFAENDWFRILLASISDGVVATDVNGRIQFMNRVAEELTGWTLADAAGSPVDEVLRMLDLNGAPVRMLQPHEGAAARQTCFLVSRTGERIAVEETGSPIHNKRGDLLGAVTVFLDVTEKLKAEQDRARFIQELERSNKELAAFAHSVSHDLQAPVRAMKTYTELLARGARNGSAGSEAGLIATITRATDDMDQLIRALLGYAQVGQEQLISQTVASRDLVESVIATLRPMLAESGATVQYGELPVIEADPVQLRQVFQNLLTNALKYGRPGVPVQIRISAAPAGSFWRFCISDNGQGIAAENLIHIFEPLRRLHGSQIPGTGLGLAICRTIVERHGGSIWAESAGPDQGSTFCFRIERGSVQ